MEGFVYILTNPSFREDWVKIGKSSRPVDVRSKELDNTAVPLPFEIYATLRTTKYAEAERMIHKQIDRLTTLRIRSTREFFNVKPEVALEIFQDIAEVLDDAVIDIRAEETTLKPVRHSRKSIIRMEKSTDTKEIEKETKDNKDHTKYVFEGEEYNKRRLVYAVIAKYVKVHPKITYSELEKVFPHKLHSGYGCFEDIEKIKEKHRYFAKSDMLLNLADAKIAVCTQWGVPRIYDFLEAAKNAGYEIRESGTEPVLQLKNDKKVQAPPFKFSMVGINIGEKVTFAPDGTEVIVVSDNKIEYKGVITSLSGFTMDYFQQRDGKRSEKAGTAYFTYKGKKLYELRKEQDTLQNQ